jgi:anaerobic selenocysteine-containing dehydrogenase
VDGTLVRIGGNPLHPVSRGGLCPKGVAGIQLLYHPGRITGPIERTGPPGSAEFQRISWEVSGIMREILQGFTGAYGTPHLIREDYADGSGEVMELSQGIQSPPAFDLAASDFALSFGASLSESWESLPLAARARESRGGSRPHWVQIDVRHSRTAARADEWIPTRPGTYGTLALGIMYVLLKEGLYDAGRAGQEVAGLEDWTDAKGGNTSGLRTLVLRHGRTDQVSERTGIPGETIVRLAKAFGSSSRPVALWDQSVGWRTGGLADAMMIHALNVVVGALDRPGGLLVQPPLPVPEIAARTGNISPASGSRTLTPANWAARVASGGSPSLKALFLYYANPVASAPSPEEVVKALDRIPLVVSFSPFLDESARHADLVLPDHTYLERWQDAPAPPSVPIPVWGVVQPVVPARHDTRATGDVVLDLAARLEGEVAETLPWKNVEEIVRSRGKALAAARRGSTFVPDFRNEELRELEARGWWLPHRMSEEEFWGATRESGGWFDPYYDYNDRSVLSRFPDGKVRVFPAGARDRIASGTPGLVEGFLPLEERPDRDSANGGYPLRLVPYRVMTLASGGTALTPWLLESLGVMTGDAWETWAEINPETGHELGLTSGQHVRVESEAGSFQARLRFFPGAQPGALNVPYGLHTSVEGWGACRGANPVAAVGNRRDPSTGLPDWHSTWVRVAPA